MESLTKGHLYNLDNFENPEEKQTIQFIEKKSDENGELITINDGTTNEEVMAMLIDRMTILQENFPCEENERTIQGLKDALQAQNDRTAERKTRGVEGKHEA